jgi:hypothetical protein
MAKTLDEANKAIAQLRADLGVQTRRGDLLWKRVEALPRQRPLVLGSTSNSRLIINEDNEIVLTLEDFEGFADPTAQVGLTVVPGNVATLTAMRSDAAPPLDQGIAPTWTSSHIWDDGAGDSPSLLLVGGSNDDTVTLSLDDDAVAGNSDFVLRLAGDVAGAHFDIRNNSDAGVAFFDAVGNLDIEGDLFLATGKGIIHADGVVAGMILRADGTRYVPSTLDVGDLTDLAYATPALTLGLANAAGVADTVIRSDATILAFDATNPSGVAAAAATGSATVAARRDHVHNHPSGLGVDLHHPQLHAAAHQDGGGDEINVAGLSGELADAQPVAVSRNSGAIIGTRSELNFIEGSNITLTIADDAGDDEVDITIAAAGSGPHTILDATVHTDSAADTVTRGSLIYGNSTPLWDELVIGAAGTFLRSSGSDPSWTSIAVGDLPDHAAEHEVGGGDLVDHDALTNFVANEHINHTGVTLTAGNGLTGGGNIAANRTFTMGTPSTLTTTTTNAVTATSHTHNVTTTADGDTNVSTILQSDASGGLRLDRLGIGVAASGGNRITLVNGGIVGNGVALTFDDTGNHLQLTGGALLINETANANMTFGVTIDQGENDDEVFNARSSDVEAVFSGVETGTYLIIQKGESSSGGAAIAGYKDADGTAGSAMQMFGFLAENPDITKTTAGRAIVETTAFETNGTNLVNVAANGNVFAVRTRRGGSNLTVLLVDEDGDVGADGNFFPLGDADTYLGFNAADQANVTCGGVNMAQFVEGATDDYVNFFSASPGTVFVRQTSNTKQTYGFCVNQQTADDEAYCAQSTDVFHGITSYADARTYWTVDKHDTNAGGARIRGYRDDDSDPNRALVLQGFLDEPTGCDTLKSSAGCGIVSTAAFLRTSGTTIGAITAGGNLFSWRTDRGGGIITVGIMDEDGELHLDAGVSSDAWDSYGARGDLDILHGLRADMMPDGHYLKQRFAKQMRDSRPILESTGVVTYNEVGRNFVGVRSAVYLTMDVVRTLGTTVFEKLDYLEARCERYEQKIAALEQKLLEVQQ